MKRSDLLFAGNLTILALLIVIWLALSMGPPATALLANAVSAGTATPGCPPRPTWTAVPVPTFRDTPKPPTPAPMRTSGPPRIETSAPVPTLVQPLATEEQVLKWVLDRDMRGAKWDDPWCLETPRLQPGRIIVEWYPSMKAYEGSGPTAVSDTDPIWVVTIPRRHHRRDRHACKRELYRCCRSSGPL